MGLIEAPDRQIHRPWILDPQNPLAPAQEAAVVMENGIETTQTNTRDNVEQVVITNPLPGTYTIKISHKGKIWSLDPVNENSDGINDPFTLEGGKDQPVSLIISGNSSGSPKRPSATIEDGYPAIVGTSVTSNLRIEGFLGIPYQLQMSTDLTPENWTDVDPFFYLDDVVDFKSVIHSESQGRFYWVKEVSPIEN